MFFPKKELQQFSRDRKGRKSLKSLLSNGSKKQMCQFLGSRAEKAELVVSGAGENYYSHGTGGKIRSRKGDLVFPRSHNLPREARPAVAKLYISQSHRVTLFQQKGG